MNIAPRYLGRGSWLARRDPRVLILAVALFIFTVLQVWDGRLVLGLLVLSVVYYRMARIPWSPGFSPWAEQTKAWTPGESYSFTSLQPKIRRPPWRRL